jgi:DNA-directed RNA polymerase specialized sigma24 family protein
MRGRQIADVLGIHEGAVKSRLYRARQNLGALLAERRLADA